MIRGNQKKSSGGAGHRPGRQTRPAKRPKRKVAFRPWLWALLALLAGLVSPFAVRLTDPPAPEITTHTAVMARVFDAVLVGLGVDAGDIAVSGDKVSGRIPEFPPTPRYTVKLPVRTGWPELRRQIVAGLSREKITAVESRAPTGAPMLRLFAGRAMIAEAVFERRVGDAVAAPAAVLNPVPDTMAEEPAAPLPPAPPVPTPSEEAAVSETELLLEPLVDPASTAPPSGSGASPVPTPAEPSPAPDEPAAAQPVTQANSGAEEEMAACLELGGTILEMLSDTGAVIERMPLEENELYRTPKYKMIIKPPLASGELEGVFSDITDAFDVWLESWTDRNGQTVVNVMRGHIICMEIMLVEVKPEPEPAPEPPPPQIPVPPLPPPPVLVQRPDSTPAAPEGGAQMAVILDDGGYASVDIDTVLALDNRLTLSILPNTPLCRPLAERASRAGFEVMLHMPMDAGGRIRPFPGQLELAMDKAAVQRLTREALAQVPGARGVNNHTGGVFVRDHEKMVWFMEIVRDAGLFFVDSRTVGSTRGYAAAVQLGVRAANRDVFLDNDSNPAKIRAQFEELAGRALAQGRAVGIGHFRPNTVAVLAEMLPGLARRGITLVHVSELVQ